MPKPHRHSYSLRSAEGGKKISLGRAAVESLNSAPSKKQRTSRNSGQSGSAVTPRNSQATPQNPAQNPAPNPPNPQNPVLATPAGNPVNVHQPNLAGVLPAGPVPLAAFQPFIGLDFGVENAFEMLARDQLQQLNMALGADGGQNPAQQVQNPPTGPQVMHHGVHHEGNYYEVLNMVDDNEVLPEFTENFRPFLTFRKLAYSRPVNIVPSYVQLVSTDANGDNHLRIVSNLKQSTGKAERLSMVVQDNKDRQGNYMARPAFPFNNPNSVLYPQIPLCAPGVLALMTTDIFATWEKDAPDFVLNAVSDGSTPFVFYEVTPEFKNEHFVVKIEAEERAPYVKSIQPQTKPTGKVVGEASHMGKTIFTVPPRDGLFAMNRVFWLTEKNGDRHLRLTCKNGVYEYVVNQENPDNSYWKLVVCNPGGSMLPMHRRMLPGPNPTLVPGPAGQL